MLLALLLRNDGLSVPPGPHHINISPRIGTGFALHRHRARTRRATFARKLHAGRPPLLVRQDWPDGLGV
eukprot:2293410-Pyramimonas_sp.AAC.1